MIEEIDLGSIYFMIDEIEIPFKFFIHIPKTRTFMLLPPKMSNQMMYRAPPHREDSLIG